MITKLIFSQPKYKTRFIGFEIKQRHASYRVAIATGNRYVRIGKPRCISQNFRDLIRCISRSNMLCEEGEDSLRGDEPC